MSYLERRALLSRHPISPEILSSQGDVVQKSGLSGSQCPREFPRPRRPLCGRGASRTSSGARASRGDHLLDRDRDGLLVFFVGVVLLCVAAAVYFLADLLVAAAPVVMLASLIAVSRVASNASRRGVGQWRGAGGACCEDHFGLGGGL